MISCMTDHPALQPVGLNIYSLQNANMSESEFCVNIIGLCYIHYIMSLMNCTAMPYDVCYKRRNMQ